MLDQSFSFENFRILLDVENRKGRYLEDPNFFNDPEIFKESRKLTEQIIENNREIKIEYQKLKSIQVKVTDDYLRLNILLAYKETLKEKREVMREVALKNLAEKTNNEHYKIEICKGRNLLGNQLYNVVEKPEHYFVLKQLQRNIYKTFKVKQADRRKIISQLKLLLDDAFPKVIIRTDIQNFYESIPHQKLLKIIDENSLLSYPSKRILRDILNQYWKILTLDGIKNVDDERVGIPRGIGISAFLAELYLRDLDRNLKLLDNVTYYSRYVDDIILIVTPRNRFEMKTNRVYVTEVRNIIKKISSLNANPTKTKVISLKKHTRERKAPSKHELTYLGYKFTLAYTREFDNNGNKKVNDGRPAIKKERLKVSMSEKKRQRYISKITLAFYDFNLTIAKFPGAHNSANRLLIQRVRFLTNNHRLVRRKSYALVGIYFSNEFLNDFGDIHRLDSVLKEEIEGISATASSYLLKKLKKCSFINGFKMRSFRNFDYHTFQSGRILKVWNTI